MAGGDVQWHFAQTVDVFPDPDGGRHATLFDLTKKKANTYPVAQGGEKLAVGDLVTYSVKKIGGREALVCETISRDALPKKLRPLLEAKDIRSDADLAAVYASDDTSTLKA